MHKKIVLSLIVGIFLVPASALADPPEESGIVIRYGVPTGVFFNGNFGTRMVTYGGDPIKACEETPQVFDLWYAQDVLLPVDEVVFSLFKGPNVRTQVWPFAGFNCDLILTVPPLAEGTSTVVWTDNNLWGSETDRANSWNVSAHGVLYDALGEDYVFQHNLHCTWKGDSIKCHSKIRLR